MTMNISGSTKLYGVIADPIAQVQSPQAFNQIFKDIGTDAVCLPFHVKQDQLAAFLAGSAALQNCEGIFVSVPHKEQTFRLIKDSDATAQAVASCNVLRRHANGGWYGAMFDGYGLVDGMIAHDKSPHDKRVVVLGAGGVSIAIVHALLQNGAREVVVCNRTVAKALRLRNLLLASIPDKATDRLIVQSVKEAFATPVDCIVQATSLGMASNDPVPLDLTFLKPAMTVVEVVAKQGETQLLRKAKDMGCSVVPGSQMYKHQIDRFRSFFSL